MTSPAPLPQHASQRRFSVRERFLLWLISWAGYLAIRLIGPTLRFAVSAEDESLLQGAWQRGGAGIYPFWHNCVFPAAWFFRNRGFAVITSQSFDGEYIARIIGRLGYKAVRGSSSRGGAAALLEMHHQLLAGHGVAFTIDGPRGPRYVAKPGPVLLARSSGAEIVPFYIALQDPWVLPSWDGFMLPKPFSRALVRGAKPIAVPRDADDETLRRCQTEMQQALERVRDYALAQVGARPLSAAADDNVDRRKDEA